MRIERVHGIIKVLSNKERKSLLLFLRSFRKGGELIRLYKQLEQIDSSKLVKAKKWSRKDSRKALELLEFIVTSFGRVNNSLNLENEIQLARKLVSEIREQEAEFLMRMTLKKAFEIEDFESVLQIARLGRKMFHSFTDQVLDLDRVREECALAVQFEMLETEVRRLLREIVDKKSSREAFEKLQNSPILRRGHQQMPKRALCYYWKIKVLIFFSNGSFKEALEAQDSLTTLLKRNPWLENSTNFEIVQEHYRLINMHFLNDNFTEMERLILEAAKIGTNPRSKAILIDSVFTSRLILSIDRGDVDAGNIAYSNLVEAIKETAELIPDRNLTRPYYFIAYYGLSSGKVELARNYLNKAMESKPSKFPQYIYPATCLMDLIALYELEAFEGVLAYIPRLKYKNHITRQLYKDSQYYKYSIDLLEKLSQAPLLERNSILKTAKRFFKQLITDQVEIDYMSAFNIAAWVESKLQGTTMAEIFKANDFTPGANLKIKRAI